MPTLDWIGKSAVVNLHRQTPRHELCHDDSLSAGDARSGNLLVQGDNLLALAALLPEYGGRVKCIYIDPPYNTGSEGWIYNDNVNSPEIREWLGKVVGNEAEDLSRHDKWLCMMYPRLALLREFLADDGVIFVSIDDNEVHNLRAVMGEIFGNQNFVAHVIWQKKYTRANDATYFSDNHDFLVCFARDKKKCRIGRIERTDAQDRAYKNPDKHPLGPWKPTPLHAKSGTDARPYCFRNGVTWQPPAGTFRRFPDESLKRLDEAGEIWFGKNGDGVPQRKTFLGSLDAGTVPVTIWTHDVAGDNHLGRDELKELVPEYLFDSPKPLSLLSLVLQLATTPDSIVLDAFAGSGTTGHAVLAHNKLDGGCRRFICIEMNESICRNVTAPRLRRAIEGYESASGIRDGKANRVGGLGGGFQFLRVGLECHSDGREGKKIQGKKDNTK
ncbi:MAG TPA: site-specific DNA-methyltransferase [Planctomycetaceae bacterium]|jgi:site-specific DNA-methyltransferase (adenine-specific)/adenine-specific DNA-methyltransferase